MLRMHARAAAVVAVCSAVGAILTPAAAQHEHHAALDTVKVRAERDVIQLRSGATIVDVRGSAAAGGSIADLLRTVPGVELDADGRISIRGSTGVLELMNGRRISLTGDALVAFLRQVPAAAVVRLADGSAGAARRG